MCKIPVDHVNSARAGTPSKRLSVAIPMPSDSISDLVDHFKLETEFRPDYTLEIVRTLHHDRGRRMVRAEKKWTKQRDLGHGSFGEVWLDQQAATRAVKSVKKNRDTGVDYHKELLAMAKLSKV